MLLRFRLNTAASQRLDPIVTARQIETIARRDLMRARQRARETSTLNVQRQLGIMMAPATFDFIGEDIARSGRASRNLAEQWLKRFRANVGDERSTEAKAKAAAKAVRERDFQLQAQIATETADSFSRARQLGFSGREGLMKRWDATLDKSTCELCYSAHGEIVPIDEPFSNGEPGSVHPNCYCVETILTAAETYALAA